MTRVLVCGGRDYDNRDYVHQILDALDSVEVIIEGGATGADLAAASWATFSRKHIETFPADWKTHGKAAGPIRNQRMIDEGKPDLVIAFPGGRGTADMIRRAEAASIPVRREGGGG
ncbi:DUF2493 domain-containing protein [Tianweitania sediminis]|uniref:DUF2493 domain-containing protein n=1 Tax=Tianweitania sediminis TaxID=1502156 RepID=A0A8J7R9A8_9HYPH|nr:DUF2493 domain-containing protein [Tianweitania sediminis]MBP0440637.1 DUF2493 domain-containing protein [Tianweitania sediminis]